MGNVVLAIQRNREQALLLAQVEKRLAQGVIFRLCILVVYVVCNLRDLVAQEMLDDCGCVGLTGSVGAFNPKRLVDVCVVGRFGLLLIKLL